MSKPIICNRRKNAGGEGILGAAKELSKVESSDRDSATWVIKWGVGRIQEAADDHEVGEVSVAQHVLLRPKNQPYATTVLLSTEIPRVSQVSLGAECPISGEPRTTAESESLPRQFNGLWQRFSTAVNQLKEAIAAGDEAH